MSIYEITIDDMDLGYRANDCLKRAGINMMSELVSRVSGDFGSLLRIKNLGSRSLKEICLKLQAYNVPVYKYLNEWIQKQDWGSSLEKDKWVELYYALFMAYMEMHGNAQNVSKTNGGIFDIGNAKLHAQGKASHEKGMKLLTNLGSIIRMANSSFDIEKSLDAFDLMMQCFLLKLAAVTGRITNEDVEYIAGICNRADVIAWVNKGIGGNKNITLSWLTHMSDAEFRKLPVLLEPILNKLVESFVAPYAVIDTLMDRDVLSDVKDVIIEIMAAFVLLDGNGEDISEKMMIFQILNTFTTVWKNTVNSIKKR